MSLFEAVISALKAIWANKMRSALTMLGIVIGIFSVVALISLGSSSTSTVTESIEGMGSNLITVMVYGKRIDLNLDDVEEMGTLDGVGAVSPYGSGQLTLKNGTETMDISVEAVNEDYDEIREYELMSGRFINENDEKLRLRVAVVGIDVANELYGTTDVVGNELTAAGVRFTIIGVLEEQGDTILGSGDEIALIPFSTGTRLMKNTTISSVYASAQDSDSVDQALSSLEKYLDSKTRNIGEDEKEGYSIFSQSSILDTLSVATKTLTLMLGGIAGISLLVGGIGIMNIMLVSVTERTREIGVRKAIGATRSNILTQFLIESIFVSAVGGILGVLLAQVGINILSKIMDMAIVMSPQVVLVAVAFSIGVGVVFGMYPAWKASKLNPIEALRYE